MRLFFVGLVFFLLLIMIPFYSTNTSAQAVDVCDNLDGIQTSVPEGMDQSGSSCVPEPIPDQCTNISGNQESVPEGMNQNGTTCSSPPPVDRCNNIAGNQSAAPPDHTQMADGSCILLPSNDPPSATDVPAAQNTVTYTGQQLPRTGGGEPIFLVLLSISIMMMGFGLYLGAGKNTVRVFEKGNL